MPPATPPATPGSRPAIDYPCLWTYKVIGSDTALLRAAIVAACAPLPVEVSHSHSSSAGRYHSLSARVEVPSEEIRLQIYATLSCHPEVKIVL